MKRNKKKKFIWITIFILAIFGIGLFLQADSVAVIVNEKGSHKTVEAAFDACESDRTKYRAEGQDCEPCRLTCPDNVKKQSNNLYSFSYIEGSAIYEGTFKDLDCDTIGEEVGRLLEVKSFCNDNIRVCEEQDGTGSVLSETSVNGGKVQKVSYRVYTINCETDKKMGDSTPYTSYRLVCDETWVANGQRVADYKSSLGHCEPEDPDLKVLNLDGEFNDVAIDSRASTDQDVTVKGTFKADRAGTYYIYASIQPKGQAFSVLSGFGSYDLCAADPHTAGLFKKAGEGDIIRFELSVRAPYSEGSYEVKVAARDGCYRDDLDSRKGDIEIYSPTTLKDSVIIELITEDPSAISLIKGDIKKKLELLSNLESCTGEEDFTVDGCEIAECIDGEVFLLSENEIAAGCDDQELAETIDVAKTEYYQEESQSYLFWIIGAVVVLVGAGYLIFRKKR